MPTPPDYTTISDILLDPTGNPWSGSIQIYLQNALTSAAGKRYIPFKLTDDVVNGVLYVQLTPNSTATPTGTTYLVKYFPSGNSMPRDDETWLVPSGGPYTVAQVAVDSLPPLGSMFQPSQILAGSVGALNGDILTFDGSSATWLPPTGSGGGSGTSFVNLQQSNSASTWTFTASQHGFSSAALGVRAFDASGNLLIPTSINVNPTTFAVTVTFPSAISGRVKIYSGNNFAYPITSAVNVSIPADMHKLILPRGILVIDSSGNAVPFGILSTNAFAPVSVDFGDGTVWNTYDINISFATPQTGTVYVFGD